MFLGNGVLKICSKVTGENPCQSVISIKLQSNFIEIILRHECSPVNLLHIFRTSSPKNISGGLFLLFMCSSDFPVQNKAAEINNVQLLRFPFAH